MVQMLARGPKSPLGTNTKTNAQVSSSSKRKRGSSNDDSQQGEESNTPPITPQGRKDDVEGSITPPSIVPPSSLPKVVSPNNVEEVVEVQRRQGKAPIESPPSKEDDGNIYQPPWEIRRRTIMTDVDVAKELMWHMFPDGERERVHDLPRSQCEDFFLLCQSNATSYAMELLRRSHKDKEKLQALEKELAQRGQMITSLQGSLKGRMEENEALKKEMASIGERATRFETLEQERTMEVKELRTLVHDRDLEVEELSNKVKQREDEISNLQRSLNEMASKFGSSLEEQEMSEVAKREGCKHFLKSENGQGLVLRLVKGSCKNVLIEAQETVQEKHPEYLLPDPYQAIMRGSTPPLVMPWEDDFPFDSVARPYPSPPLATESVGDEEVDVVGGDVPPVE